jgi:hypothetical protein
MAKTKSSKPKMTSNWSDNGSEWGGDFSQVGRNPRREEYAIDKKEAKQVRDALALPIREPDIIDHAMSDGALDRAVDVLTTKRTRDREARLRYEAEILAAEVAKRINTDDNYADATPAERAEMDAYLDQEDEDEEPWESGIAWS